MKVSSEELVRADVLNMVSADSRFKEAVEDRCAKMVGLEILKHIKPSWRNHVASSVSEYVECRMTVHVFSVADMQEFTTSHKLQVANARKEGYTEGYKAGRLAGKAAAVYAFSELIKEV